jgi:hypothetical protein
MKKLFLQLLLFFAFSTFVYSAFELRGTGARETMFSSSAVALNNSLWSISFNAAGLASLSKTQISISYSPQRFGLKEFSSSALAFAFPLEYGTVAASAHRYGYEMYNELSSSLAFAKNFQTIAFGVALHYNALSIQRYGNDATFGIDVGTLAFLSENVSVGFSATNINAPTITQKKERLPQLFSIGVSYYPMKGFTVAVGAEKDVRYKLSPSVAIEYFPIDELALRVGVHDEPTLFNGGFGIRIHSMNLDYTASLHQVVGLSHYITVTMQM